MQVNVIESVGISGMKVELSLQNCIVLKSLITELEEVKADHVRRNNFATNAINNAIEFIKKVSGEITSLEEAGVEMFGLPQTNERENEV